MTPPAGLRRTQNDVLARIAAAKATDLFGFRLEVLVTALDFEHARAFLRPDVTAEAWAAARMDDVEQTARAYYDFALGKIRDHRRISASRSVDKLSEYAWLLGRDDIVTAMDAAEYSQYGAPKVAAFGAGLGLEWPDEQPMNRMRDGQPCTDDCYEGCSQ